LCLKAEGVYLPLRLCGVKVRAPTKTLFSWEQPIDTSEQATFSVCSHQRPTSNKGCTYLILCKGQPFFWIRAELVGGVNNPAVRATSAHYVTIGGCKQRRQPFEAQRSERRSGLYSREKQTERLRYDSIWTQQKQSYDEVHRELRSSKREPEEDEPAYLVSH
jgi:hypothetical protein